MLLIIVIALTTAFIRFLPFIVVRDEVPSVVKYLGSVLQYATMAMLVVYCLKVPLSTSIFNYNLHVGFPEIVASILIILSYKMWHNTLLSIVIGTVVYMVFVNFI